MAGRLLLVVPLLAGLIGAPLALRAAPARSAKSLILSYEVRARDARIGHAEVTFAPRLRLDGRLVRPVTIRGGTDDLAAVLFAGSSDATSWLDAAWRPVKALWRNDFARSRGVAEAQFAQDRVRATFSRPGREPFALDQGVTSPPLDLVSFVPWLMQQKPKPDAKWQVPVFTGMAVCQAEVTAGAHQELEVPLGRRRLLPVAVTLSQCKVRRQLTIWLDAHDFTPHRLTVDDPYLGAIEARLLGRRTHPAVTVGRMVGRTEP